MADTFYAQVWAYTLGLGLVTGQESSLRSHLKAESFYNDSPYGLLVLTGRTQSGSAAASPYFSNAPLKPLLFQDDDDDELLSWQLSSSEDQQQAMEMLLPLTRKIRSEQKKQRNGLPGDPSNCNSIYGIGQDNAIWMGGSPDWTTLNLYLGMAANQSLAQAQKALNQWRLVLNDQWNVHGLMGGIGYGVDGLPFCTSHYGFHMVLWHIPFALSGQQYSAPNASLTFSPKIAAPYQFPVLIPKVFGFIRTSQDGTHTLQLLMGSLELDNLAVNDDAYPSRVSLQAGQSVSWD